MMRCTDCLDVRVFVVSSKMDVKVNNMFAGELLRLVCG